ncbi:Uncharacterized protein SCF082_LOCUS4947 [Durusdinium trenchii]|uniref:Ion transport domain-containing protein n=1 Tax=Durusdinium trenchii TaxID=1381693 RepID=A0ABP0I2L1_9DINO
MGLEAQNLFNTPEVQAELKLLPLSADLACSPLILQALAETANEDTLETDTVHAVLWSAWIQHRWTSLIDILLNGVNVVLLCLLSLMYHGLETRVSPSNLSAVLAVLYAKEVIEWFLACFPECLSSGLSVDVVWDTVYCGIGWVVISSHLGVLDLNDATLKPFMAVFSCLAWLRMLYSLRGEAWLGPRFLPIVAAIKDTAAFFFITTICVMATAHGYYQIAPRAEDPSPIFSSLLQTFRLGILGDFDLFEFEGQDTEYDRVDATWVPRDPEPGENFIYVHVIFFLTSIGITVILMNIFIAVLGQNLELFQDQAQQLFARARAKMLLGQHQHPWARLWRFCCARIRRRTRDDAKSLKDPFQRCSCLRYVLYRSLWPLSILAGEQAIFRSLWSECLRRPRTAYVLLFFCPMTFFLCLACLIPFGCCCLVFRKQGLQFWFRILFLGIYCCSDDVLHFEEWSASGCLIWVFLRPDPPREELRSTRTALDAKMQKMESKVQEIDSNVQNIDAKMKQMDQKMDDILNLLREKLPVLE